MIESMFVSFKRRGEMSRKEKEKLERRRRRDDYDEKEKVRWREN